MKTTKEHLHALVDQLPPAAQMEVLNYLEYIAWKYQPTPTAQNELTPSPTEEAEEVKPEPEKKSGRWSDLSSKLFS